MVNTYRKGNRTQQKAKRYYESIGYLVEVVRRDKWRPDQDFFGLWDLICVGWEDIRFVQVKTNAWPTKEWYLKVEVFPHDCNSVVLEVARYNDYQRGDAPSERDIIGH